LLTRFTKQTQGYQIIQAIDTILDKAKKELKVAIGEDGKIG